MSTDNKRWPASEFSPVVVGEDSREYDLWVQLTLSYIEDIGMWVWHRPRIVGEQLSQLTPELRERLREDGHLVPMKQHNGYWVVEPLPDYANHLVYFKKGQ